MKTAFRSFWLVFFSACLLNPALSTASVESGEVVSLLGELHYRNKNTVFRRWWPYLLVGAQNRLHSAQNKEKVSDLTSNADSIQHLTEDEIASDADTLCALYHLGPAIRPTLRTQIFWGKVKIADPVASADLGRKNQGSEANRNWKFVRPSLPSQMIQTPYKGVQVYTYLECHADPKIQLSCSLGTTSETRLPGGRPVSDALQNIHDFEIFLQSKVARPQKSDSIENKDTPTPKHSTDRESLKSLEKLKLEFQEREKCAEVELKHLKSHPARSNIKLEELSYFKKGRELLNQLSEALSDALVETERRSNQNDQEPLDLNQAKVPQPENFSGIRKWISHLQIYFEGETSTSSRKIVEIAEKFLTEEINTEDRLEKLHSKAVIYDKKQLLEKKKAELKHLEPYLIQFRRRARSAEAVFQPTLERRRREAEQVINSILNYTEEARFSPEQLIKINESLPDTQRLGKEEAKLLRAAAEKLYVSSKPGLRSADIHHSTMSVPAEARLRIEAKKELQASLIEFGQKLRSYREVLRQKPQWTHQLDHLTHQKKIYRNEVEILKKQIRQEELEEKHREYLKDLNYWRDRTEDLRLKSVELGKKIEDERLQKKQFNLTTQSKEIRALEKQIRQDTQRKARIQERINYFESQKSDIKKELRSLDREITKLQEFVKRLVAENQTLEIPMKSSIISDKSD